MKLDEKKKKDKSKKITALSFDDISVNTNTAKKVSQ